MSTAPKFVIDLPAFLSNGGECGRLIAARDWSDTLGPVDGWPLSLKAATALLLRSAIPMVMLWSEDGIMIYNDAYSIFAGGRHPQLLGSAVLEGWPEVADFNRNVMDVVLAGGTLAYRDQELTLYRHGGPEQVFMDLDYSPVIDDDGEVAGVLAVVVETTQRVATERALRESEQRLRLALTAAEIELWDLDPVTDRLFWPEQVKKLFGIHSGRPVTMADFYDGLHPEDREGAASAFAAAVDPSRRALYDVEYRTIGLEDGVVRWVAAKGRAIFDESGTCVRVLGTALDISPRKTAELHQRLLIDELSHRTKNLLAIIQGLAHQSFRGSASPAQMKRTFEGRLGALAAAHNVITRQRWERAPIRSILLDTIAAVLPANERVELTGPDLLIPPKTAVSLAIAIHELATNALKYGSLLGSAGQVALRWEARDGRLRLRWEESGGPPVVMPTQRGFGTRMIERGLASELNGEVRIDFRPTGLVCTVDAPLPEAEG